MTSQLIITLAILAFMIVMFVWQKFPMGVTTMTCCALLAAFGILSPSEAFGGFTNNSIILVAPMMALSSAITKTSIVPYIRNKVNSLSGKKGIVLILFFYLIVIAFVQFIPATATFSIMIVFLASLSNDGEVTSTRLLMPMLGISCAWKGFLPIGMGATSFATINAIYGTIITDEGYWLGMFDKFRVSILSVVCLTIYCLVAWKLLPKRGTVNAAEAKEVKETKTLPKAQETLVYVVFIAVMAVLVLNKWTGKLICCSRSGRSGPDLWQSPERSRSDQGSDCGHDLPDGRRSGRGNCHDQVWRRRPDRQRDPRRSGRPSFFSGCHVPVQHGLHHHDHPDVQLRNVQHPVHRRCYGLSGRRLGSPRHHADRCHRKRHLSGLPLRCSRDRSDLRSRQLQAVSGGKVHRSVHSDRDRDHFAFGQLLLPDLRVM